VMEGGPSLSRGALCPRARQHLPGLEVGPAAEAAGGQPHARLKRLVADQALDIQILKEAARPNL